MEKKFFVNEIVNATLKGEEPYSGVEFGSLQAFYELTEADYLRLTTSTTPLTGVATGLIWAIVGFVIPLVPKMLPAPLGSSDNVSQAEWIGLGIASSCAVVFLVIGCFMPSEKKKLLRKMKDHFDNKPRVRSLVGKQNE